MAQKVRIALDGMGGDFGPAVVVPGAELALARHPESEFILFGNESAIRPLVEKSDRLKAASRIVHTDVVVKMDAKPSQALRQGRWKSSMWLALDAVKKGDADVAVSAGNTGALMAMAKFNLHTMPGIERPAIAGLWPTLKGDTVMLDMGASIGAEADHLVDLAVMGSAMARVLFDLERPTVGLLNIGVEEVKGLESVREAGKFLRDANLPFLDYVGFVEADTIGQGAADVIVTEGFAGNIAIKTAEGTAKQITSLLRVGHEPDLAGAARLSPRPRSVRDAARQDGPAQGERRRVPRPERHRHQEPRWNRRGRLCGGGRCRLRHGPLRVAQQDPRYAPSPCPRRGRQAKVGGAAS